MLGLFAFTLRSAALLQLPAARPRARLRSQIVADIVKRPYITVGFSALVLLVPLAVDLDRRLAATPGRALAAPAPAHLSDRDAGLLAFLVAGQERHHRTAGLCAILAALLGRASGVARRIGAKSDARRLGAS